MHFHPSVRKWALRLSTGFNWLFLGGLAFIASWFLWQRWEVRSLEQQVRSLGLPTTREELDRLYVVPAGVLDNSASWNPPLMTIPGDSKESAEKELQSYLCDPTRIPRSGEPWDMQNQVIAVLDAHRSELNALYHAASIGGQTRLPVNFQLDSGNFENFNGQIRSAVRLLRLEAGVAAYQGDPTRCRLAQMCAFDLYLAIQGQPDEIAFLGTNESLSRIAATFKRLFVASEWSDAELASLQQKLCSIDYKQQLKLAIVGECVSQLDLYKSVYPFASGGEVEVLQWSLFARQSLDHDWPTALTLYQQMADQKALERQNRSGIATMIYGLFAPYDYHFVTLGARVDAERSMINTGLAVQRYRMRHGRLPVKLAEIDADLIGKCADGTPPMTDPFDGHPLRYLVQPDRCLIYSIGHDRLDNGGDVDFDDSGDRRKTPQDMGFSVSR